MADFILVFLAMCCVDVCWALYNRRSNQGKALQAGLFSMGIVTFSSFTTIRVVDNHYNVIAAAAAGLLATWVTVHFDHKRSQP